MAKPPKGSPPAPPAAAGAAPKMEGSAAGAAIAKAEAAGKPPAPPLPSTPCAAVGRPTVAAVAPLTVMLLAAAIGAPVANGRATAPPPLAARIASSGLASAAEAAAAAATALLSAPRDAELRPKLGSQPTQTVQLTVSGSTTDMVAEAGSEPAPVPAPKTRPPPPPLAALVGRPYAEAEVRGATPAAPIGVMPPPRNAEGVAAAPSVVMAGALSGSTLSIDGTGTSPSAVQVRALVDSVTAARTGGWAISARALRVTRSGNGWTATLTTDALPTELRVTRGTATRLLLLEGYGDSIPRISLRLPVRDSVLRRATGRLPLESTLHDDLGLASGTFELIVSSGEGERFTARTLRVGARAYARDRDVTLRAALNLDSMQLAPGDIVHLRAVARDAHPGAAREAGSSETRSLRVARPAEYDSVSVEPAPPPEVDKSLISQRMLLMLTEKLEQRRLRITTDVLKGESARLSRDQTRLRLAVGDAVFQRLSGESSAEHAHTAGDGHDHGVEAVGGKLALPGTMSATGMLDEGDDSPVIGINKPLLEAYNAMWDAGRALEQADPRAAIPHMRVALAAIERARAASRLYLRGKPPTVILDLARIRLAGKDTGVTNSRSARRALPPGAAAREARLLAAAELATGDPSAAHDSVAVLRLESLADAPEFARALATVVEGLRNGGEITDVFVRARRVLGGVTRGPNAVWSRGGPP